MAETRTPKQIAADKVDELIERLEAAEGPSRELDVAVMNATCPRSPTETLHFMGNNLREEWGASGSVANKISYFIEAPRVTASLDAAVALAERVLPGWRWGVTQGNTPEDDFQGNVWPGVQPYPADLDMFGYHKSAPLALCLATLKAVRAHMHPRDREETNQ